MGDPDLGKEESLGFDLSLRKSAGRITGSLSLFYNRFDGFIAALPTGERAEDEEGLPVFAYRAVDANFAGGEMALTFHLIEPSAGEEAAAGKDGESTTPARPASQHRLHLDTKADYVRAQNRHAGRSLPRITPFRTSAALVYSWDDRFDARIEGQYVHEQDRTAEFELPTDGYFLLNASASYRMKAGPLELEIYLKGANLTNEEARLHTSFLKDVAPLAGRGVLLGMRASF